MSDLSAFYPNPEDPPDWQTPVIDGIYPKNMPVIIRRLGLNPEVNRFIHQIGRVTGYTVDMSSYRVGILGRYSTSLHEISPGVEYHVTFKDEQHDDLETEIRVAADDLEPANGLDVVFEVIE